MNEITLINSSGSTVLNGLYGFNLEITRKTVFGGLSMQMLNNRKFYAHDTDNEPAGWKCDACAYITDKPELSLCGSSFIAMHAGSAIKMEDDVFLRANKTYELKLWLKPLCTSKISVILGAENAHFEIGNNDEPYLLIQHTFHPEDNSSSRFTLCIAEGKVNLFQASLMDADNFFGMNKEVISLLKKLKPTYLRFPGGCCADHFDWKESLKPVELRKPIDGKIKWFLFPDTYGQDTYDIGINEFMMLCGEVGAEPEYTVSVVLSGPLSASALVEYCNGDKDTYWGGIRASLGFSEFHIKNWYVGNEIYYFGYELAQNPVLAAETTDRYISAMREADPDINIIVGACGDGSHDEWDSVYFSKLISSYDYISFHCYCGTAIDNDDTDKLTCGNIERLGSKGRMERLDFLKYQLFPESWDRARINIDEWNLTWGQKGSNLMLMANALMFHFMVNSSHYYRITDARFFHPLNEGLIDIGNGTAKMDSSGILFDFLNGHRDGVIINKACDDCYNPDTLFTLHKDHLYCSVINRKGENLDLKLNFGRGLFFITGRALISSILMDSFSGLSNLISVTETYRSIDQGVLNLSLKPYEILFIKIQMN